MSAEFDVARDLADHVDLFAAAEQQRIVRVRGRPARIASSSAPEVIDSNGFDPRVAEDFGGPIRIPVRDADQTHPGDAVDDLVCKPLRHEPRADHADPDRACLAPREHAVPCRR